MTCVYLDSKTLELLDNFGNAHAISRSAAVRLITNDFFLKQQEGHTL